MSVHLLAERLQLVGDDLRLLEGVIHIAWSYDGEPDQAERRDDVLLLVEQTLGRIRAQIAQALSDRQEVPS